MRISNCACLGWTSATTPLLGTSSRGIIQKECQKFQGRYEDIERHHPSGIPYKEHIIEAQATYARGDQKNRSCQFVYCWLKVRHCEKFTSLEVNKRLSKSSTPSVGGDQDEGEEGSPKSPTPDSSMPPAKRAQPPGRKQSKQKLRNGGGGEYKEVMQNLLLMKADEQKLKEERWKTTNMLEERRVEIEERQLMWEQEQKIMFSNVSTMDPHQMAYVLAMRAQIAAAKVVLVVIRRCLVEVLGAGEEYGDGRDGIGADFSSV